MKYLDWLNGFINESKMPRQYDMAATVQAQSRALRDKDSALLAALVDRRIDFENRVADAIANR